MMILRSLVQSGVAAPTSQSAAGVAPCAIDHPETDFPLPCASNGVVYTQTGEMDTPIAVNTQTGAVTNFNPLVHASAYLGQNPTAGAATGGTPGISSLAALGLMDGDFPSAALLAGGAGGAGASSPMSIAAQIQNLDNVDGDMATSIATAQIYNNIAAATTGGTAAAPAAGSGTATAATNTASTGGLNPLLLAGGLDGDLEDMMALGALGGMTGNTANLGGISGNAAALALAGGSGDLFTAQVLSQGPNAAWLNPKAFYGERIDGDVREDMQKAAVYGGAAGGLGGLLGTRLASARPQQQTQPQAKKLSASDKTINNPWFWAFFVNVVIISSGTTYFLMKRKQISQDQYSMYQDETTQHV